MTAQPRPQAPVPQASLAETLVELAAATDRLLATVDRMSPADFAGPSLRPGWSRAHVLAHLALHAKGLTTALTTLGRPGAQPLYLSEARRAADVGRLAAQAPAAIADRVAVGAALLAGHLGGGPSPVDALEAVGAAGATARMNTRFAGSGPRPFTRAAAEHAADLAAFGLAGTIARTPGGVQLAARDVPSLRLREVEQHHADLGFGYRPRSIAGFDQSC